MINYWLGEVASLPSLAPHRRTAYCMSDSVTLVWGREASSLA